MRSIAIKILLKKSITYSAFIVLIGLMLLGCSSTKKIKQKTNFLGSDKNATQVLSSNGDIATDVQDYGSDNHENISQKLELTSPILSNAKDSLAQTGTSIAVNEVTSRVSSDIKSPVADKIVENYLNSENKEPKGHCLYVSKDRFEQAYKEVHGHSMYQDLPDSMATKSFTKKQVFNLLYSSASETQQGWRSLPEKYRGKGNAGAITYAGMGTLVDISGIWSGQLKPGALMQVWRFKEDYEQVVQGVDVKKLDPYGHSFIFISYVRDEKNAIIGLEIADQGFQSYRPLIPNDYEVWWGVNLGI
ncbi:MAG: hypothetical protein WBM53_17965 [Maribacter sp.]